MDGSIKFMLAGGHHDASDVQKVAPSSAALQGPKQGPDIIVFEFGVEFLLNL